MLPTIHIVKPNLTEVRVAMSTYWFSYETCIAFDSPDHGLVVSENAWTMTTGRHLNAIDEGRVSERTNHSKFVELLTQVTERGL